MYLGHEVERRAVRGHPDRLWKNWVAVGMTLCVQFAEHGATHTQHLGQARALDQKLTWVRVHRADVVIRRESGRDPRHLVNGRHTKIPTKTTGTRPGALKREATAKQVPKLFGVTRAVKYAYGRLEALCGLLQTTCGLFCVCLGSTCRSDSYDTEPVRSKATVMISGEAIALTRN